MQAISPSCACLTSQVPSLLFDTKKKQAKHLRRLCERFIEFHLYRRDLSQLLHVKRSDITALWWVVKSIEFMFTCHGIYHCFTSFNYDRTTIPLKGGEERKKKELWSVKLDLNWHGHLGSSATLDLAQNCRSFVRQVLMQPSLYLVLQSQFLEILLCTEKSQGWDT